MKTQIYSLLAAAAACGLAFGQTTAYTTPVGYVTQTCTANSDSYVSLPLRPSAVAAGALSAAPDTTTTPGSAILSFLGTPGFGTFANTHYAKFKTGVESGKWFVITANSASTLTVNLNGATLTAAAADTVEVIKFWTLATLFDPAVATNDPLTTPNAIVSSAGTSPGVRRTQVLIPDLAGTGTDLSPVETYYVNAGIWKKVGGGATSFNDYQVWPDAYILIRNPVTVTSDTKYAISGEVDVNKVASNLRTSAASQQDNFVGLIRPIDVTLNGLNLGGTSAFMASTSTSPGGRRDQLLVYDTTTVEYDKAPAVTYYYFSGQWRKVGGGATDFGNIDKIPAGNGFIIRKYQTAGGATDNWINTPTY